MKSIIMKKLLQGVYCILIILLVLALSDCASQRTHHKAIPCPCENQSKK